MLGDSPVLVSMPAVDLSRATSFYRDTLGLKQLEGPEGGASVFEAGAGTRLFIYQRGPTKADHTAASFMVDDMEAVVDGLTERGVVFEQYDFGEIKTNDKGIAVRGESMAAWFKDTEGNILGLTSM